MDTGESTQETVKTIAQGKPDVSVGPVVTAACFFCCRRAMGATRTRLSLRPCFPKGGNSWHSSGASRREDEKPYLKLRHIVAPKGTREQGPSSSRGPREGGHRPYARCNVAIWIAPGQSAKPSPNRLKRDRRDSRESNVISRSKFALSIAAAAVGLLATAPVFAQDTITVWWAKGFYKSEDDALLNVVKKFEEKTGIKVELS